MIVLYGLEEDGPYRAVQTALEARGAPVVTLDQAMVHEIEVDIAYDPAPHGRISGPDGTVRVGEITGLYLRPYDARAIPGVGPLTSEPASWARIARTEDALWGLAEVAPGRVVNRPSAMRSNGSKPYQAALIQRLGFDVPDTLITNDVDALRRFRARHGDVVYKSISSVRSVVSRLGDAHEARLSDLASCPTQFQEHVAGVDYRVHVIGDSVLAARVDSDDDDYRYGESSVDPVTLPDDVAQRCIALVRGLGLALGGIDLRRTPSGRWVCFEVNPSPAFTPYECGGNLPIRDRVAAWLAGEA